MAAGRTAEEMSSSSSDDDEAERRRFCVIDVIIDIKYACPIRRCDLEQKRNTMKILETDKDVFA